MCLKYTEKKCVLVRFLPKKPYNLHFCKEPHQNQWNYSLLKLINVRARLLYRNQLQESSLTNQRFIYLEKIYCSEAKVETCAYLYIPVITVCVLSIASYI